MPLGKFNQNLTPAEKPNSERTGMKFTVETVGVQLFDEVSPLLSQHYLEIAHYKDIELDPDWEKYQKLADLGVLRVYGARSEEGRLLGYAVYLVSQNMHYKQSLQALQDVLFIEKQFRGRGGALIKWCDEQLAKEGIQVVYHHIKAAHNFGPMLERMGYKLVDLIYSKRLDQENA